MSYNQQQREEEERYAQYWAQFAVYPEASQAAADPSLQVPVVPSQPAWSDHAAMAGYAQSSLFQEAVAQPMYAEQDFLLPQAHPPSLSGPQLHPYQGSSAIGYQPAPQLSYTSEPAGPSSQPLQRRGRTYATDSYASYASSAQAGSSSAAAAAAAAAAAPSPEASESNYSRSSSPGSADMSLYGVLNTNGTWSCNYPGCTSRAVFTRGCDLRKHHKRHTKSFFCRYPGCTQATGGGFSSKKDLARHEAKHNPGVVCEWDGCDRVFSRVDNMVGSAFSCLPLADEAQC